MARLGPLWELLNSRRPTTIFQDFQLNLLAAQTFADREEPAIVWAQGSNGAAIVPAVVRRSNCSVRLLGEELFDYRRFLHAGDSEILTAALCELGRLGRPLEVLALREPDLQSLPEGLLPQPFCSAPGISGRDVSFDEFSRMHAGLARNLRRLRELGFGLETYNGNNPRLLRSIYERKAAQDSASLFHDPLRIEFLVKAAMLKPDRFQIFTLQSGQRLAAALVTLQDENIRRFYTAWFAPELGRHSPALSLIYQVTRISLAAGLDCDYLTGEQPYKLRLATRSMPLFRVQAGAEQLSGLGTTVAEARDAA